MSVTSLSVLNQCYLLTKTSGFGVDKAQLHPARPLHGSVSFLDCPSTTLPRRIPRENEIASSFNAKQ